MFKEWTAVLKWMTVIVACAVFTLGASTALHTFPPGILQALRENSYANAALAAFAGGVLAFMCTLGWYFFGLIRQPFMRKPIVEDMANHIAFFNDAKDRLSGIFITLFFAALAGAAFFSSASETRKESAYLFVLAFSFFIVFFAGLHIRGWLVQKLRSS